MSFPYFISPEQAMRERSELARKGIARAKSVVALVSPDGSVHDPDLLLVEALDAMVLTAGADASSSEIAIAVP
ncbi:hypothetical protein BS299_15210, partial [Mycobacterium tuberculosis M13]